MAKTPLDMLEELREKPEPVRKLIGTILVIVMMAAVIGIWATTFHLAPISSAPQASVVSSGISSPSSILWNFLKESVKSFF